MFRAPVLVYWLGLAWAWVGLSPADKFGGKLNLVDSAAQLDNYYFYSITAVPVPEGPKAFRYKGGLSSPLPLSLFGC